LYFIKLIVVGALIGVANIIPGVSGGTMAVVFNVYDRIIFAVNGFFRFSKFREWKENVLFLLPIGVGGVTGIFLFSRAIRYLLATFPMQTNFFFMGLVLGTFPLLINKAAEEKLRVLNFIGLILAFLLAAGMGMMSEPTESSTIIQTVTVTSGIRIFIGGFVAAAVMILPGVSGSLALMMMGLYSSVLEAIIAMNLPFLAIMALGVLLGLLTMTKILEILLKKKPQTVYFSILGLVAGSLFALYPGFALSLGGIGAIVALLAGTAVAIGFSRIA